MIVQAYNEIAGKTLPLGDLHSTVRRSRVVSTFSYAPSYLAAPQSYPIEPALPLSPGHWATGRALPRAFADAAPDRWGRNLIAKRLRAEHSGPAASLPRIDDIDYLLGVSDATRQGALRFRTDGSGYRDERSDIPRLIALPELLRAADHVSVDDDLTATKILLAAGTASLGGARPKASVLADDGALSIAKFPHPDDHWDLMAWEKLALDLAHAAGISTPVNRLLQIDGRSVLLLERFDRKGDERVGYISALTLLEAEDGQTRDYLDIAEALTDHGAKPRSDLRQLWTRIAFSIAVHNTDDHLRNHGLLHARGGWTLSPCFDVNPDPEGTRLRVTSVGGASSPRDEAAALLDAAELFELTPGEARANMVAVADAVSKWRGAARALRIAEKEIALFADALDTGISAIRDAAA